MTRICVLTFFFILSSASFGQSVCDSIEIKAYYSPFADSLIQVDVINNSSELFSYPGFFVLDINGDTVAKEEVNLFGIAQNSTHYLNIYPGMPSGSNFTGELQLWSGFYSQHECTFNMIFDLCPDSCITAYPYIINMGGAISLGSVDWILTDDNTVTVASGTLTLDNTHQNDEDTVCLSAGNYTLQFSGISPPMMGQPFVGISSSVFYSSGLQQFYNGSATNLQFDFLESCIINWIGTTGSDPDVLIYSHEGMIEFVNLASINYVSIYSISGQLVWKGEVNSGYQRVNLSHLKKGIYIAELKTEDKKLIRKLIF